MASAFEQKFLEVYGGNPFINAGTSRLFGSASYSRNRASFDTLVDNQATSVNTLKRYASAFSGASGGKGSEAARQHQAGIARGSVLPLPPKPPPKPLYRGPGPISASQAASLSGREVQQRSAAIKAEGKKFANLMKVWAPLNTQYKKALKSVKEHNAKFEGAKEEFDAAEGETREMADRAGAGGPGGAGVGTGGGPGVQSTSPGISFIKRPDTVWI